MTMPIVNETMNDPRNAEFMKDAMTETKENAAEAKEAMGDQQQDVLSGNADVVHEATSAGNPFTAMRETCDTQCADADKIKEENLQDFEAFRALPYIDVYAKKNEVGRNIEELRSMKSMMDGIAAMSNDEYSAMVQMMDHADREKSERDIKSFYETYPDMITDATRIHELLERILMVFDKDMVASTTFISKSAVESAEIRKEAMEKNENPSVNHKMIMKRLEVTKAAYADRTNMEMIFHKMRYPNNVLEIYEEFSKSPDESMKYVNSIFMPIFNDQNMTRFRKALITTCVAPNLDKSNTSTVEVMAFFMTYWLAKVYEREYQSGKCAVVKVFIMNIYDMDPSSAIYDEIGGVEYMRDVAFTIFMVLTITTNGQHTKKQLNKVVNAILDDLLGVLYKKRDQLFEENPGRQLELGTSLDAITDSKMTVDELPELKKPEADEASDDKTDVPTEEDNAEESDTSTVDVPEILGQEVIPDYSPDDAIPDPAPVKHAVN